MCEMCDRSRQIEQAARDLTRACVEDVKERLGHPLRLAFPAAAEIPADMLAQLRRLQ